MVSTDGLVHQCAWCWNVMVDGIVTYRSTELLDGSHGICPDCKKKLLSGREDEVWDGIKAHTSSAN